MTSRSAAVFLISVFALVGCGVADSPTTALIQIYDDGPRGGSFEPATLVVPAGTEVRWRNEGAWQHSVLTDDAVIAGEPSVPEGFDPWQPAVLRPGGTFAQILHIEGEYLYWTEQADGARSYGTIRVESP